MATKRKRTKKTDIVEEQNNNEVIEQEVVEEQNEPEKKVKSVKKEKPVKKEKLIEEEEKPAEEIKVEEKVEVKEAEPVKEEKIEIPKANTNEPAMYRMKKIGGGGLHLHNRIIKPGQVFIGRIEEIPKVFMNTILVMEQVSGPVKKGVQFSKSPKPIYTKQITKNGLYNIVDKNGKILNEQPMTEKDADDTIRKL